MRAEYRSFDHDRHVVRTLRRDPDFVCTYGQLDSARPLLRDEDVIDVERPRCLPLVVQRRLHDGVSISSGCDEGADEPARLEFVDIGRMLARAGGVRGNRRIQVTCQDNRALHGWEHFGYHARRLLRVGETLLDPLRAESPHGENGEVDGAGDSNRQEPWLV